MLGKLWGTVAAALLATAPGQGAAQTSASNLDSIERSSACAAERQAVDEAGFVHIGGIEQWITVKGDSCANPAVLIVHGGPGNPITPYADALFGSWMKDFTVVQWDQRGAGKTYALNRPADDEPLTLEQLTRDGVEVAQYLTARLGKRKIILMGGSWGSALAVHMVKTQPSLFHAYVGTSQLVRESDNLKASYDRVLMQARTAADQDTVGELEALGPPPWANPRGFGILRRAARKYEALKTDPAPSEWWRPAAGYDSPAYEADYRAGEDYSYLQFVGLAGDGIASRLDLYKLGPGFDIPIFLLQGEEDLLTTPEVAKAYFDSLEAPEKAFVPLPSTGHDPNQTMIDAQLQILRTRVRPKAIAFDDR